MWALAVKHKADNSSLTYGSGRMEFYKIRVFSAIGDKSSPHKLAAESVGASGLESALLTPPNACRKTNRWLRSRGWEECPDGQQQSLAGNCGRLANRSRRSSFRVRHRRSDDYRFDVSLPLARRPDRRR